MKLQFNISSQSGDVKVDQTIHLGGGGYNTSTFGNFLPGSTYCVHSFLGCEALIKNKAKYGILRHL